MKILLEAMHGMGDVVCMIPKFEYIAQEYPQAEFTILFNNKIADEVVKASNFKNYRSVIIKAHKNRLGAFKQCLQLRKEKYDLAFFSPNTPTKKYQLFSKIIKPKKCVSIQNNGLYYNLIQDRCHFVDANLLSLGITEINREEWQPHIYPDSNIINPLILQYKFNVEAKYIGISVGSGDVSYKKQLLRKEPIHTRGWGDENEHVKNMCSLIKDILDSGYNVALFGGKLEESIVRCFPAEILKNKCVINLVGKLTMTESIAAASVCSLMVGVDTGMQHVSDALGIPTVSIFGPTNPKTHGAYSYKAVFAETATPCKYCYGTPNYVNCMNRKCLSNIKEAEVMSLIKRQLEVSNEFK